MDWTAALSSAGSEEWISALPLYQQTIMRAFLASGMSPEDAAREWLSSAGPANTFPFGTQVAKNAFFDKLTRELEDFLCGDARYEEDRKKLIGEMKPGHTYLIASISALIAPSVGSSAVLIAPAVAMLLFVAGKLGLNAWCAVRKEMRATSTSGKVPPTT